MMKPEHGPRRAIIREWMSLPRDKRQNGEQAAAFAAQAVERHQFRSRGDRYRQVLIWLLPRIGKA